MPTSDNPDAHLKLRARNFCPHEKRLHINTIIMDMIPTEEFIGTVIEGYMCKTACELCKLAHKKAIGEAMQNLLNAQNVAGHKNPSAPPK